MALTSALGQYDLSFRACIDMARDGLTEGELRSVPACVCLAMYVAE